MVSHETANLLAKLPTKIKHRIFEFAGREANFAYQIATGGKESQEPYIEENALYEPFAYMDWQTYSEDELEDDKRKRRLFWEREKGFRAYDAPWSSYPSPRRRWEDFKKKINDRNRRYIKRIAVAKWMNRADYAWIREKLPALEGLDLSACNSTSFATLSDLRAFLPRVLELSDLDHFTCFEDVTRKEVVIDSLGRLHKILRQGQHDHSASSNDGSKKTLLRARKKLQELSSELINQQTRYDEEKAKVNLDHTVSAELQKILNAVEERNTFRELRWLGLDNSFMSQSPYLFEVILPACENLETLSIRGNYNTDPLQKEYSNPHQICKSVLCLADHLPDTVSTIELRMSVEILPYFLQKLNILKPNIRRVGIDLGALAQTYPIKLEEKHTSKEHLHNEEISRSAHIAAGWAIQVAEDMKLDQLTVTPEKPPRPMTDQNQDAEAREERSLRDEERESVKYDHRKDANFYRNHEPNHKYIKKWGGNHSGPVLKFANCPLDQDPNHAPTIAMLKDNKVNTLLRLLKRIFDAGHVSSIALFPLSPEEEESSSRSIHPLALIQEDDECGHGAGSNYNSFYPDHDLTQLYRWLNDVFHWRPVFDWDWLMLPEKMRDTVDIAYRKLFSERTDYIARIENQFRSLKNAGIPVHLLIGKRSRENSSCYWGWPYHEQEWKEWLDRDFDANLGQIAGLVDTLSIFYDLRNPLDKTRLDEIEAIQSYQWPPAICPAVPCPLAKVGENYPRYENCPFRIQRRVLRDNEVRNNEPQGKQKMANKKSLEPKKSVPPATYARLANSSTSAPPVGENANDHDSDDPNVEDVLSGPNSVPLHQLARYAVFTREAMGWQRFWTTYALKFTSLTMLRVRMPRCFDRIGSWRLAKLLDQRAGWEMLTYTDERQHLQTADDHVRHLPGIPVEIFEHLNEAKMWPAGRFVRRSWIWLERRTVFQEGVSFIEGKSIFEAISQRTPEWPNRIFGEQDHNETQLHEDEEFAKAADRAASAAHREHDAETDRHPSEKLEQAAKEKRWKNKLYFHDIRRLAQEVWEDQLQIAIEDLERKLINTEDSKQYEELSARISWLQQRQREQVPVFKNAQDQNLDEDDSVEGIGWIEWGNNQHSVKSLAPSHWQIDQVTFTRSQVPDAQKRLRDDPLAEAKPEKRARTGSVTAVDATPSLISTTETTKKTPATLVPHQDPLENQQVAGIQTTKITIPPQPTVIETAAPGPIIKPTAPEPTKVRALLPEPKPTTAAPAAPAPDPKPIIEVLAPVAQQPIRKHSSTPSKLAPSLVPAPSSPSPSAQLQEPQQPTKKRKRGPATKDPGYVPESPPSDFGASEEPEPESGDGGKRTKGREAKNTKRHSGQAFAPSSGDDDDEPKGGKGRGRGRERGRGASSERGRGRGKGQTKTSGDAGREFEDVVTGDTRAGAATRGAKGGRGGRKKAEPKKKESELTSPVAGRTRSRTKKDGQS